MKSSEAGFRKLAPAVDRLFRFLEMIGLTALISIIFPTIAPTIRLIGTEFALYYLLEPAIDSFAFWLVPEVKHAQDVLRVIVVTSLGIIGIVVASGFVAELSVQISRTISIASPPKAKAT